jgi:hypothetical protein
VKKLEIADMQLQSNVSFKSSGYAAAEVLPSRCGISIADKNKKLPVASSGICSLGYYPVFRVILRKYTVPKSFKC